MEMSIEEKIEEDLKHCSLNGVKYSDYVKEHYISKADYEVRLKADMVAMLTEIQLEIDELEVPLLYLAEDYEGGVLDCKKIIQQKINVLRGGSDAQNP